MKLSNLAIDNRVAVYILMAIIFVLGCELVPVAPPRVVARRHHSPRHRLHAVHRRLAVRHRRPRHPAAGAQSQVAQGRQADHLRLQGRALHRPRGVQRRDRHRRRAPPGPRRGEFDHPRASRRHPRSDRHGDQLQRVPDHVRECRGRHRASRAEENRGGPAGQDRGDPRRAPRGPHRRARARSAGQLRREPAERLSHLVRRRRPTRSERRTCPSPGDRSTIRGPLLGPGSRRIQDRAAARRHRDQAAERQADLRPRRRGGPVRVRGPQDVRPPERQGGRDARRPETRRGEPGPDRGRGQADSLGRGAGPPCRRGALRVERPVDHRQSLGVRAGKQHHDRDVSRRAHSVHVLRIQERDADLHGDPALDVHRLHHPRAAAASRSTWSCSSPWSSCSASWWTTPLWSSRTSTATSRRTTRRQRRPPRTPWPRLRSRLPRRRSRRWRRSSRSCSGPASSGIS